MQQKSKPKREVIVYNLYTDNFEIYAATVNYGMKSGSPCHIRLTLDRRALNLPGYYYFIDLL